MELTLKKLIKCATRAGRRELVKEILGEELTRDKIIGYISQGIVYGINHGINAIPQDKRGTVHTALELAHNATGRLLAVTGPTSENGCEISQNETETVTNDIGVLTSNVFTGAIVEIVHAKIIEKVP